MPTELEQYLFDHQFNFASDDGAGCRECGETGDDPWRGPYGETIPGHAGECELAAMLARAGFPVQYYSLAQGCPTLEQDERSQRWHDVIRNAASVASGYASLLDRRYLTGNTIRIDRIADIESHP